MAKKKETVPTIIDSVETLEAKMKAMREAQKIFATYTQEQVDKIFFEAAMAANKMRIPLAKQAVEETGRGIVEDKVIKNHYAAEYIYNAYKNTKTCGVIEEDKAYGIKKIAEPIGLVAAVIPTTNPTSTAIFKTLICLKTRNAIIISPHPAAKASTIAAAKVVLDAAVKAGAPEGIIGWIDTPSLELTNTVMRDADIILATDPDADRLGIYAKDAKTGEYVPFTGNMSAILIADYLLSRRQERGLLHSRNAEITKADGKLGALVTTIVSTNMGRALAKDFDIDYIETLTGFKYIGEQIKFFEESGDRFYEFGFEESYGCLVGTHARDKDAPSAVMSLCEVAAYEYSKGRTLVDRIHELYEKYGYYREGQHSITMKGADGAKRINDIMETLRSNPPKEIAGFKALEIRDYSTGVITDVATGNTHPTGLPKSNVFYLELENDAWVCSRPSGTEPKIKFYIGVRGTSVEDSKKLLNMLMESIINLVK